MKKPVEYVFLNKNKNGHRQYTTNGIRAALDRCMLHDVTIHTFRHTFCSRCVQAGMSLYEVANLVGHSSEKMTQRYSHLIPNEVSKKAANLLDEFNNPQPIEIPNLSVVDFEPTRKKKAI